MFTKKWRVFGRFYGNAVKKYRFEKTKAFGYEGWAWLTLMLKKKQTSPVVPKFPEWNIPKDPFVCPKKGINPNQSYCVDGI